MNTSNKIAGQQRHSVTLLCESRVVGKGRAVLGDVSYLLYGEYGWRCRYRLYPCPEILHTFQFTSVKQILVMWGGCHKCLFLFYCVFLTVVTDSKRISKRIINKTNQTSCKVFRHHFCEVYGAKLLNMSAVC